MPRNVQRFPDASLIPRIKRSFGVLIAAAALLGTSGAGAEIINATRVHLIVGGADVVNVTGGGPNAPAQTAGTRNEQGINATFAASANQNVTAKAALSGSAASKLYVRGSTVFNFKLTPPAGTNMKGVQLILHGVLEGPVTDGANLHLVGSVELDGSPGNGHASANIVSSTVPKAEFDMPVTVSPFADSADLGGRIRLYVDATAETDGATSETFSAEATAGTRITGFRVLSPTGTPITGFTMAADGGAIPEIGGATTPTKVPAVEFFHAGFGHYFMTADPDETAKLDDGTFPGWSRTGKSFNVYSSAGAELAPTCRFYTVAFPPSNSHFYTANTAECAGLKLNPKWTYEQIVFYVPLPSAQGVCPAQTVPVFRLFNNGQGGAPNHRFTTSTDVRAQMLAQGFADEGVVMCSLQ